MIAKIKPKKCKCGCGESFVPRNPMQIAASPSCAQRIAERKREKETARLEQLERQETRRRIIELKPMQYWLKRAEKAVNAFIRERDKDQPCISCGTWDAAEWHAGHFIPVGRKASIRFDYANIHKQCSQCNVFMGGNLTHYEIRLISRIGQAEVDRLKFAPAEKKWTREELAEIEAKAKADLKALISGQPVGVGRMSIPFSDVAHIRGG